MSAMFMIAAIAVLLFVLMFYVTWGACAVALAVWRRFQ